MLAVMAFNLTRAAATLADTAMARAGTAEAAGIEARAKALSTNQDAVIAQQFATTYPAIVAATSGSLSNIDNLVVLH